MQVGALEIELLANIARLQHDMDMAKRSVGDAMSSIDRVVGTAQKALGAFGIGIGAISFGSLIKGAVDAADKINDVAKANEVAVGSVLKLSQALKLNGGESESASKLFSSLTSKLGEAAEGGAKAQAQFKAVGITLNDLRTLDGQKLFEKTLQGLGSIEDPIKRNAAAMDLLGKAAKGVDISGLATDYASNQNDFDDAEKSFRDIGIAMDKLDDFTQKTSESLATTFGPVLRSIVETVDDAVFGFDKLEQNIRKARQAKESITGKWTPSAGMNDKPVVGQFNLPGYESNDRRDVIDAEAEAKAKKQREEQERQAKLADAARKKRNDEILKDIQQEVDFEQSQKEALNQSEIEAVKKLEKEKEQAYKKELERVEKLERIAQDNFENAQNAFKKAEEEKQREFEKTVDANNQIFREGFANMVNGGKGTWKSFNKSLITTFKTTVADQIYSMLAKPFVVKLVASVMGLGVSGAASASGGFFSDAAASGGGSIFSTISDGLSSLNTNVVGSIEKLGAFLSNGNGGLADKLGGALGQYSSQIATAMSFAPAVMSLLKGDVKGALFQGGGAAIGTILGGPVGGAIGSFLGGALGGMFGGKKLPPRVTESRSSTFANGKFSAFEGADVGKRSLGAASSLDALNEAFAKNLNALFSGFGISSTIGTNALLTKKKSVAARFNASLDGVSLAGYQQNFGKKGDFNAAINAMIDAALGSVTVQAIQASKLTQGIKMLFDGLTDKTQVTNMINASLALSDAQLTLSDRFGLTLDQAGRASMATGLLGDELSAFATKLAKSAQAFQTVGDVLVKAQQSLSDGLGGNVPATLKDFDNILKGIDKTTQAGIESFVAMFALRDQFAAFTSSMDGLKSGVRGALFGMVNEAEKQAMMQDDLNKLFNELGYSVPASVDELIALGKSIDYTTKEGINLAAVFPSLVTAFMQTKDAVDSLMDSMRDTSMFKTLVDYTRYQRVAGNYGTGFANSYVDNLPSFAVGSNYIPNDMTANIHEGERVIPAADNREIIAALNGGGSAEVAGLLRELLVEMRAGNLPLVQAAQKTAKVLQRIDDEGVMINETNNAGMRTVLDTRAVA